MTYLDTIIENSKPMILKWHGRTASFSGMTRNHASLWIEVLGDEYGKNLLITCQGPEYICGPYSWPNSKIMIQKIELESGDKRILLTDEDNGVRVICATFKVKENARI